MQTVMLQIPSVHAGGTGARERWFAGKGECVETEGIRSVFFLVGERRRENNLLASFFRQKVYAVWWVGEVRVQCAKLLLRLPSLGPQSEI
jgi:hypothetical protein